MCACCCAAAGGAALQLCADGQPPSLLSVPRLVLACAAPVLPLLPLLLVFCCRRYLARRSATGVSGAAPGSLRAAAQRAADVAVAPMAGVLNLLGLLDRPKEVQRLQQAEEDAAAAAAAEARLHAARKFPPAPAPGRAPTPPAAAAAAAPAAARAPVAALQQEALDALEAMDAMEAAGLGNVPAGRSPAEAVQAAAAPDMAEVDMRDARTAALRARQPKVVRSPEDLAPRHTARPDLTAAANAVHMPHPLVGMPPVAEAATSEDLDANAAFSLQVCAGTGAPALWLCAWAAAGRLRGWQAGSGRTFVPAMMALGCANHWQPASNRTLPSPHLHQPVDQLTPLEGEDRMWDTEGPRSVRWGRLAASAALLAGGALLLCRAALLRAPAPSGPAAPPAKAAPAAKAAVKKQAAAAPAVTLSRAEAAAVIGRWQAVKAAALGPKHDAKGLAAVLRGEVLDQWRDRAAQIKAKGW